MHLTNMKKSIICCSAWHLHFWSSVYSSLSVQLLSKLQYVFVVLVYNW